MMQTSHARWEQAADGQHPAMRSAFVRSTRS
jgi:hypothetical protein